MLGQLQLILQIKVVPILVLIHQIKLIHQILHLRLPVVEQMQVLVVIQRQMIQRRLLPLLEMSHLLVVPQAFQTYLL